MIVRLDARLGINNLLSPSRVAARVGITRNTVRKAIVLLRSTGWLSADELPRSKNPTVSRRSERHVRIPEALLNHPGMRPQAIVIYGALQAAPDYSYPAGKIRYSDLSKLMRLDVRVVKRAVAELVQAGWLEVTQKNQRAPVCFSLRNPITATSEQELPKVRRRLKRAEYRGEALMREYLSLIVDSDEFEDNASPGFLVNPLTDERMQLDRFYPPGVAFEFNGPQHYGPTEWFTAEEAAQQRCRDLMKMGICVEQGIGLIVIHAQDLSLHTMMQKIGDRLPTRDLHGHEPIINYLESQSRSYRAAASRAGFTSPTTL